MGFFEDVYSKLFEKKSDSEIISFEVIRRSDSFLEEFRAWVHSDDCSSFKREIQQGFELKKKGIDQSISIHLLNTKHAKGLAISYSEEMAPRLLQFLMDYLGEEILKHGYKLANADEIIKDRNGYVESIEKRYLKPISSESELIDQKYGNLLLEYICINNEPSYLKFTASSYSDSSYEDAKSFDTLINLLLS